VIAMTATLGSSVVAFTATVLQTESSRQQAADEFRRTRQRDAYAALLASSIKFREVEVRMDPGKSRSVLPTPGTNPVIDDLNKFQAADADFTQALAGVELVGSSQARDAALKLQEAHSAVLHAYIMATGTELNLDASLDFHHKVAGVYQVQVDFIEAARKSLDI